MANNLAIGMVIGASLSSGFHGAFSGAKKKLEQLEQAVAKNQQSHSKLGSELTALRTKQATLYAEMSRASSKGGTGLILMQQEYKKIGKEIANISREQRKWSTELEKSIAKQTKLRKAMARQAQAKENRDELKGKVVGTVASAAVGVGVMKTYMEQEEAANNLKIAMMKADGSYGKFEEIGKIAGQLGTDLPGTKKDFYKLAMALKKQGISDDVLTGGALKTSAELNVLLDMDQESGGEFLAKFMESHRLNENELPQAADYLQRAMFAGGLSKAQMYESMKYYAPKLNSMKLTGAENTEKVLAIEAMAGQQGLEGSTFGTGLNMMLERMNSGPKMLAQAKKGMKAEARDMMEAVGVEFNFWDKNGSFKGIDGMLSEMTKFEKIRAKFGDEGVGLVSKELFGIEGGRLADILAMKGQKGLDEMLVKMREQASLQDRINLKTNTLGSALESLGGAWETFVGDIGSVFAEDIKGFSKGLQAAVEWLVPFVSKHKEAIKFVGGLVAGLVILRGVLQAGSFVIQAVTMAMDALKIATMTNPIGLVIGTIAAGAYLIYSHWDSIAPWFANLWQNVTAYFNSFWTWVQGIWSGVTDWVSSAWSGVTTFFSTLWTNVSTFFSNGISNLGSLILAFNPLSLFQSVFSTVLNWFGIDLPSAFSGFGKNIIDGLVNGIRNAWEGAKQVVTELGSGIKNWFAEKLGIHSPSRVFMEYGDNISQGLAIGIAQTAVQASNAVSAMGQRMQSAVPKVLPAPVITAPKAPRLSQPDAPSLQQLKSATMKNERLQYIQRMQAMDKLQFKPILNTVETSTKPLLNDKKGFFGSLWDDVKFGANFVSNLFGLNQPSLKAPDFNPNASGHNSSIFSDYEPLNRNAITQRENSPTPQIVVNFNPTINVNGNATQEAQSQIMQQLQMSAYEFEKLLNRVLDQRNRRAY